LIGFEQPALLLLLLLFPLALWYARRREEGGAGLRLPLAVQGGEGFDGVPLSWRILRGARIGLLGLSLAALALAAAGPSRASPVALYTERGNAIMLVLDLSPSMAAADFEPTRLEAAKRIVKDFLSTRRNETVGLVAFGAEAVLLAPPTLDHAALAGRLDGLEAGSLGEGTALGPGIALAAASVARVSAPERHLILVTDGEANAGSISPATAAAAAARAGIVIAAVGVGSKGESPIEFTDPATGEKRSGTYRSAFDEAGLAALAATGGGAYFPARDREALSRAFDELGERSATEGAARTVMRGDHFAAPLVLLAAIGLVLATLLELLLGGILP
jgi:Ca-activated chloride channel family protein